MKAVVTGAAGFIGSRVADALRARGFTVGALDDLSSGKRANVRTGIHLTVGDVRDREVVAAAVPDGTDCVFHLAAQVDVRKAADDPAFDEGVNVGGTINVLSTCVGRHVRRFIMSSTGGALYGNPSMFPASERAAIRPLSPYGVSKRCAELYVEYFQRICGLETVVLRYGNVYGPGQNPEGEAGVVGIFARRILLSQPCIVYGSGKQTRDFVFVEDAVQANVLAVEGMPGTYNIGTGVETSMNELLTAFERVVGHAVEREYAPGRPTEVQRIVLDAREAGRGLSWHQTVSLEDGLARTLEWVSRCL